MNDSQIIHTQQVVSEFLRERLAADAAVNAKQANNLIEGIESTFDAIKTVPIEKQMDVWISFLQLSMQTRVYFYEQTPSSTPSIFCEALTVAHIFLWRTLQKSSLKQALTEASQAALNIYSNLLHPAFFRNTQTHFEKERIKVAALNNEHILNNDDKRNDKKPYPLEKIYPSALYQLSNSAQESILNLENKWQTLSSIAISQEKLMRAQVILIEFLARQKNPENTYIDKVNQCLAKLIAHQTSGQWTNLLLYLMESYIDCCQKKSSTLPSFFGSNAQSKAEFGDALKAVHTCLLQMITDALSDSSCTVLDRFNATRLETDAMLATLRDRRSSNEEAIQEVQLRSAALGNSNSGLAMPPTSDNKRISAWVAELQSSLKPPALIAQKKSEATAPITSVAETLHPNVTMRKKEKPKRITYNPQLNTSF